MTQKTFGIDHHDYSAVDHHFEELNERAKTRTGWLRAATFWSYARSVSLLMVALGLALCLVLLGYSFLNHEAPTQERVSDSWDTARVNSPVAGDLVASEPVATHVQTPSGSEQGRVETEPELPRSEVADEERIDSEELEPRSPGLASGTQDPAVPMVYGFTMFDSNESSLPGIGRVVTGKGFESSTSTAPAGQWCYAEKGAPPVSARIDLAVAHEGEILEAPISEDQRAELGLTSSDFQRLRNLCAFS